MSDHYSTLGVSKNASDAEIKAAWKKLAKENHPDKFAGDDSKMKAINAAYDAIKTADKRARYNAETMGNPFGGFSGFSTPGGQGTRHNAGGFEFHFDHNTGEVNIDELLRRAMGGGFGFTQRQQRNQDINLEHVITLEEAFTGKTVDASFSMPDGTEKNIRIDIPPAVEHGDRIRFAGQGFSDIKELQPGDLYVHIKIRKHPRFERHGQTLAQEVSIDALDAMVGTNINIKTIDGGTVSLKVPAGTQPRDQLRLRGKGFTMKGIEGRGDLIIVINITIPKALTSEEESLLRQAQALRKNS